MQINKKIAIILIVFTLFVILIGSINKTFAGFFDIFNSDVDRINQYYITVNPRKDGSLDIRYDIQWEVLKDEAGELSEVFIGIPNSNLNQIKALSSNIASLKESNGLMKVTFKEPYKGKQIVDFSFSIHQMNICTVENGNCNFSFTPGWFDEIQVKDIKVFWNSKNVLSADSKNINSDGYYVWEKSLGKGKKLNVNVTYLENSFHYPKSKDAASDALSEIMEGTGVDASKLAKDMEDAYSEATDMTNVNLNAFNLPMTQDPNTALKNVYKVGGLAIACLMGGFVLSIFAGLGRGYSSHGGYGYYGSSYGRSYRPNSSSALDSVLGSFLRRRWPRNWRRRMCMRLCWRRKSRM